MVSNAHKFNGEASEVTMAADSVMRLWQNLKNKALQ